MKTVSQAYAEGKAQGQALLRSPHAGRWKDLARGLARAVGWPVQKLIDEVVAYDRQRLDAVPDLTTYPELRGYRDLLDAGDRGMRDAGVEPAVIALERTLSFYHSVRILELTGRVYHVEATPEHCRVLIVPDSPDGFIHAKNVDDPLTYYVPDPPTPPNTPWPFTHPLMFDGVGSGLHMDEPPPEIFPVEPRALCKEHCTTVPEATQFMVRYNYFWSGQNLLVHDERGESVAFEKTRCLVATRGPDKRGINFITGMGALDPGIREHQTRMRQKYLDSIGQDWTSMEGCYWKMSQRQWDHMTRYVRELPDRPTIKDVNALMEKRDPDGPLCLSGEKCHPDEKITGWTLQMRLYLMDKKRLYLRQVRDGKPAYLDKPEVIQYV